MLSLAGHVDHTATIDPAAAPRISIALITSIAAVTGISVAPAAAEADIAAEPSIVAEPEMPATTRPRARRHRASSRTSASRTSSRGASPSAAPTKVAAIPLAAGESKGRGSGTLLESANVAAMIYVDGRPTGLTTPQTLSLSSGPHKVTLLDASTRKAKTTTVEIEANGTAKLAREFQARRPRVATRRRRGRSRRAAPRGSRTACTDPRSGSRRCRWRRGGSCR